jgi:hypothetical protein
VASRALRHQAFPVERLVSARLTRLVIGSVFNRRLQYSAPALAALAARRSTKLERFSHDLIGLIHRSTLS